MDLACFAHADRAAEFRCAGCRRALCVECVEESHRLWICRHCRERALPIGAEATVTPGSRARARLLDRPYSLAAALGYVFRARGALTLPAYVLFLTAGALLPPPLSLAPLALAALILPGFLFEIVRTTYEGADELPEWPDFSELGARALEWLQAAAVVAVAALPALLFRRLAGCDVEAFLIEDRAGCVLAWTLGAALGYALAMFGFGAVGAFASGRLAPRLDLHLEALVAGTRADGPLVLALIAALFGLASVTVRALGEIPLVGVAVLHAATGYALFTAAHLAGVLFRRHRARLEAIYLR